jgi:hypothetical protein
VSIPRSVPRPALRTPRFLQPAIFVDGSVFLLTQQSFDAGSALSSRSRVAMLGHSRKENTMNKILFTTLPLAVFCAACRLNAAPIDTAFTYQGRLADGGSPVTGTYDFQFFLSTAAVAGSQVGNVLTNDNVSVSGGLFATELDFGAVFSNQVLWLDVSVRPGTNAGAFIQLTPRQKIAAAPQAQYALSANAALTASNALTAPFSGVSGVPSFIRADGSQPLTAHWPAGPFTITAAGFAGNGSGLTNLNASNIASGTLADARLSGNIPRLNAPNTWTELNAFRMLQVGISNADQFIYFFDGGPTTESLKWNNASNRFELSDNLRLGGPIAVDTSLSGVDFSYNAFRNGGATPESGDISNTGDVYVGNDLEVGGTAYFSRSIYMNGTSNSSLDANQFIYFYNSGDRAGESVSWNESLDKFSLTDDLHVDGTLEVTGSISGATNTALSLATDSGMQFMIDRNNDDAAVTFSWYHHGTTVNANKLADLSETGALRLRGNISQSVAFDIAESFFTSETVEPGSLVRIDPRRSDTVRLTTGETDALVIGVVSTKPGFLLGGAAFDSDALGETWGEAIKARFSQERAELKKELLETYPALRAPIERASAPGFDPKKKADIGAELEGHLLELFHQRHFAPIALSGRVPVKVDPRFGEIRPGDLLAPSPIPGVAMKATKPGPTIGTALEGCDQKPGKVLTFIHRGNYTPEVPVKELHAGLEERNNEVAALRQQIGQLEKQMAALQKLVAAGLEQGRVLSERFAAGEPALAGKHAINSGAVSE